ncbi:MAG: cyclic nucleotide-gated ion channel [Methyloligellaceae bacterium]
MSENEADRDTLKSRTWRVPGISRRRVHDILEQGVDGDSVSTAINVGLVTLILLNVVAFAAETMPELGTRFAEAFRLFNLFSVAVFTVEYAARLWSCVEIPMLRHFSPWRARLHFAVRPLLLIDLLAILPFYLSFLIGIDLRWLRVLRLFRFLKLARYSPALHTIGRVLVNERRALLGALLVMVALILFASTGIYVLERNAQPDVFSSVPASVWWALATLTTVGYGDVVPVTPLGKMFGGLIMVFGLGMFALPIAIVATGFSQEVNRREFVVTWGMVARVPLFANLDAKSIAEIVTLLEARSYPVGMPILRAGDSADAMYFIAAGEVGVDADGGPVVLGEGEFFGEMALLAQRLRTHAVTARTKCRLLVLNKPDFLHLCRRQPEMVAHIRDVADARIRASRPQES